MAHSQENPPETEAAAGGPAISAHIVPVPILLGVFAALMALTWATVGVRSFDLGPWNLVIAMVIATVKATLVALYFMHLRYDKPFYALLFATGLLFVAIFISLTLLDTLEYQPDTDPWADAVSVL